MQKAERLLAIERIIGEEAVSTQEELLRMLGKAGIECTQATLSRNLRQLGVARVPDGSGGYRYAMPGTSMPEMFRQEKVKLNIVPVIKEIVEANGLIVIKTIPGNASNTAYYIDGAGRYEIAGTIAGDDTILVIPRDGINTAQVHSCLEVILPGIHEQIRQNHK